MYLFTRSARLGNGRLRESLAWAVDITERVNRITDLNLSVWTRVFSPGTGTLTWTCFVEDLAQLEAGEAKLLADDGYAEAVDQGAALTQPGLEDGLAAIVSGQPDPNRQVEYVAVTEAIIASGALVTGMTAAIEIAQRAEKVTGLPVLVTTGATGEYGKVQWTQAHENVSSLQKAQQAITSDPELIALIDRSAPTSFQSGPGATTQFVVRRLA
jgi:hypothetical protein